MIAVEKAALYLAAAVYTEPHNYGPMVGAVLPSPGFLPAKARKTYEALSAAGMRTGSIDYAVFDIATASDEFAQEMRHLDGNQPEHGMYGRNSEIVESWANRVRNWADTQALRAAMGSTLEGLDGTKPVGEITAGLISSIEDVAQKAKMDSFEISDAVAEAHSILDGWLSGKLGDFVPTGIDIFDDVIGGYPVGETTMIFGRTGGGKSAFLVNDLVLSMQEGSGRYSPEGMQYVFTAEMSSRQLVHRMASRLSGVPANRFKPNSRGVHRAPIDPKDIAIYRAALEKIEKARIILDPSSAPTPEYMYAQLKQADAKHGVNSFWVDYIEKVVCEGDREDSKVARAAMVLKSLAKSIGCPGLVLGQYNRNSENDYGIPRPKWIKASSTIEQEAHTIIHLHWLGWFADNGVSPHEVWPNEPTEDENTMWLLCTKNRQGETGRKKVHFDPTISKISPLKVI